jgi:glycosyltransferase involved in cell wall biosynthesis
LRKKEGDLIKKILSIIIPAFNEGKTIHIILDKVKAVQLMAGVDKEVIIVNDFSTDNTEEEILRYKQRNPELNIEYYKL